MNLHEHDAKRLLVEHGINVPPGYAAETAQEALELAKRIKDETGIGDFVIKALVHSGGRGKAGGVKFASSPEEASQRAEEILGMKLVTKQTGPEGKLVRKVLVAREAYLKGPGSIDEIYMGVLLDRNTGKNIVMYSSEGGMEIEEVAEKTPEKIFVETVEPGVGLTGFQKRNIAFNLGLKGKAFKGMVDFVGKLYQTYIDADASLVEINPLLNDANDDIVAADCKITVDDNALFRHKDLAELFDPHEEDPAEVEAGDLSMSFVKLSGNVGCMVNGAGLAMATMDAIKLSGGEPANFLDVGGGANAQRVEGGLRIILKDENVKLVFINIFGGIVRCDRVAGGVVEAYRNLGDIGVPLVVRLQGTNAEEGAKMIQDSGLKVEAVTTIEDATAKIHEILSE